MIENVSTSYGDFTGYDFFARFLYIKTQFYKTKGVANGNDRRYTSEFIYGYRGHNYVCSVTNNIFSRYHVRGDVYTIFVKNIIHIMELWGVN